MVESFWTIPDVISARTPVRILREQAAALTEQTKGALVGVVETDRGQFSVNLEVKLEISVPALNDYRFRLLTYHQPVEIIYPGTLETADGNLREIPDENSFISAIKAVLSSELVKNVLISLLSQATAARQLTNQPRLALGYA
jgi:hypothetical protein